MDDRYWTLFIASKASAVAAHQSYAQYDGYFDGDEWGIIEFSRAYRTKGGVHFHAGQAAMARPTTIPTAELLRDFGTAEAYDAYDPRTTHVFLVLGTDVRRFVPRVVTEVVFHKGDRVHHQDGAGVTGVVLDEPSKRRSSYGMTRVRWISGVVEDIHVSQLRKRSNP